MMALDRGRIFTNNLEAFLKPVSKEISILQKRPRPRTRRLEKHTRRACTAISTPYKRLPPSLPSLLDASNEDGDWGWVASTAESGKIWAGIGRDTRVTGTFLKVSTEKSPPPPDPLCLSLRSPGLDAITMFPVSVPNIHSPFAAGEWRLLQRADIVSFSPPPHYFPTAAATSLSHTYRIHRGIRGP
ncbi:hypothetical protein BDP81DRAFT_415749 [Colletotrichum phormii]|uniref:Uncharacterized protein n=1 Tax=Colletotrichum phormii TaxID=359342 RepID=A0AAJ0A0Y7_9PEZI|nr:uncharacterized protein BDP81DRAFT_415749 [Colletotrichum phormii]KAK1654447.1 hypothetical protein BDP81DRAFT_415749 [Colletotrichum phormii]